MEHAQRAQQLRVRKVSMRLNPYFNGTCSKRLNYDGVKGVSGQVLILILMEHAQRVWYFPHYQKIQTTS